MCVPCAYRRGQDSCLTGLVDSFESRHSLACRHELMLTAATFCGVLAPPKTPGAADRNIGSNPTCGKPPTSADVCTVKLSSGGNRTNTALQQFDNPPRMAGPPVSVLTRL